VVMPKVRELTYRSLYHSIIGTKILLAFVLFGILTAVLVSASRAALMEEWRPRWLPWTIVLSLVILLLGATLRRLWDDRLALPTPPPVIQPAPGSR
jgi:hypothetical protein